MPVLAYSGATYLRIEELVKLLATTRHEQYTEEGMEQRKRKSIQTQKYP